MRDSVAFALSDLHDEEALLAILQCDTIDSVIKSGAIQDNIDIMLSLIRSNQEEMNKEVFMNICQSILSAPLDQLKNEIAKVSTDDAEISALINQVMNTDDAVPTASGADVGYAVYRDGVVILGTDNWHTGIVGGLSPSDDSFVIEHPGYSGNLRYSNLNGFIAGNTFKGYYKPTSSMTTSQKNAVASTARKLAAYVIPYTFAGQIGYSAMNDGHKLTPADLATIRCDGVVEFSYEYNNIRISGNSSTWNICIDKTENFNQHSGTTVTPIKQATQWMSYAHG